MSKISLLPDLPLPFLGTDLIPVTRAGVTYKAPASALKTFVNTDPSVVPSSVPFRGALVRRAANLTGLLWPIYLPWSAADRDTDAFWTVAASTRLTVPAGVTKVRISGFVVFEATASSGAVIARPHLNGAAIPNLEISMTSRQGTSGYSDNTVHFETPVLDVVAGDYFEVQANSTMAAVDQILTGSWFQIEVVETQA